MRYAIFFLVVIICAFLQATLLNIIKIFNLKPDLLLVCAVFAALTFELRWVLAFAIFSGALKDIFSFSPFGLNTILFALLGFLVFKLSKKIFLEDNLSWMIVVFAAAILYQLLSVLVLFYLGNAVSFVSFLRIGALGSIYSALFFPLLCKAIKPWGFPINN